MWSLRGLAVLRGEDDLERVLSAEVDGFGQGLGIGESRQTQSAAGSSKTSLHHPYFSLNPPPTPLLLPCTDTVASANPHLEAAAAAIWPCAASASIERKCESLIVCQ